MRPLAVARSVTSSLNLNINMLCLCLCLCLCLHLMTPTAMNVKGRACGHDVWSYGWFHLQRLLKLIYNKILSCMDHAFLLGQLVSGQPGHQSIITIILCSTFHGSALYWMKESVFMVMSRAP